MRDYTYKVVLYITVTAENEEEAYEKVERQIDRDPDLITLEEVSEDY